MSGREHIIGILNGALGVDADEVTRLSGGASRETWRASLGDREVILQRQRVADRAGFEREVSVLRAADASGVPVPRLLATGVDDGGHGYVITEAITGETIARRILRDDALVDARSVLTGQIGAALARVHSIAPGDVDGLDAPDPLDRLRTTFDAMREAHPAFEIAFAWLAEHRPAPVQPAVVHGDFRLGNLIVGPDGLRSVLDWELVHLGDPMEDLGWVGVRAWRFGSPHAIAGVGGDDELFEAYEAAGGAPVDPDRVRWWRVFGTLQWGVICMMQARTHLSGVVRSHELAAIGRRVCENEYDVLIEIGHRPPTPPALEAAAPSGVHDAPSGSELLDSVAEFLSDQVVPAHEGRLSFHARVAANIVSIVSRELSFGPQLESRRRERLERLGAADESELAAQICSGALDTSDPVLIDVVFESVIDKLLVANPRYL